MQTTIFGLDPTLITLIAILGAMTLSIAAALTWGVFHLRAGRLPAATRLEDVRERLALKQVELAQKEAQVRELEQREHERDRLVAEVQVLEQRLEEHRLEWENVSAAREEIGRVKEEAAEAALAKAEATQELAELRSEIERNRAETDPERLAFLKQAKEDAQRELDRVKGELEPVRAELDAALRAIAEARAGETRAEALRIEVESLREELNRLEAERAPMVEALEEARADRDAARHSRDEARRDVEELEQKRGKLQSEIAALETLREVRSKESATSGGGSRTVEPLTPEQRASVLADLVAMPTCLVAPDTPRGARADEAGALHEVATHLRNCGLTFSRRTLQAFHTALKINDTSQLTVLAGVSGTGKSLLPRRYAEAMGIHFLQVAVEPRWDSPQDLLGFYNYVEQKYRATELARLLAHLDPWRTLALPEGSPDRRDHMALVLLDEMNLARVEYYFSEFLSRLEARPAWRRNLAPRDCEDSMIPVDIRGLENAPRLFPSHNLLFVGTMNDDESTQSLSDKVLDRGNVLQFPAPTDFPPPVQNQAAAASDAQTFQEWRSWIRPADSLQGDAGDRARQTIGDIAQIMRGFGRPFGYRLNQAIRAYVANYPTEGNAGIDARVPLADQIEFRILPKLRGVEIQPHLERFERLEKLIRDGLDDAALADKLQQTRDEQERGAGLFVWRGIARGE